MMLPGPEVTHRWQGRTLVDHHGEPLGSIEIHYGVAYSRADSPSGLPARARRTGSGG
jgi:hypothetical protein